MGICLEVMAWGRAECKLPDKAIDPFGVRKPCLRFWKFHITPANTAQAWLAHSKGAFAILSAIFRMS